MNVTMEGNTVGENLVAKALVQMNSNSNQESSEENINQESSEEDIDLK